MSNKYFGWIAYEDAFGCYEEGISEETIDVVEEKYGRIVDNGGEIVSVNFYLVKEDVG